MNKSIFITGCDTDIGKTFVSVLLCLSLKEKGYKTGYFKPFQSGAYEKDGVLMAPDVEELKKHDIQTKYSYLFKGEVSPHLASILDDVEVDMEKVRDDFLNFSSNFDYTITEGAGGLFCPAVKGKLFCDVIKELNQEIIIVTTPDLGRINHTLMTIECAKNKDIKIKGIVINKMPEKKTTSQEYFIKELQLFTDVPILAIIPDLADKNYKDTIKTLSDAIFC